MVGQRHPPHFSFHVRGLVSVTFPTLSVPVAPWLNHSFGN